MVCGANRQLKPSLSKPRHMYANGFYPQSGSPQEVGAGDGFGYTVNVALPEGYTDACLLRACQEVLVPAAKAFRPDLLLVSAGFDAMTEDPLGDARCSADGFARVTKLLNGIATKFCSGRLFLALEGGYHQASLASCLGIVGQTLLKRVEVSEVDTDEKFASFVASLAEQSPLQESLRAIWATRLAHQELPLQLLNGCTWSQKLVPFSRLRKKRRCSHWRYPHDLCSDND